MRTPLIAVLAAPLALAGAQLPDTTRADTASTRRASAGGGPCAQSVADGTRVRVRTLSDAKRHTGAALGWATPAPRVVTARGDTVALRPEDERAVSLGMTGRHTWVGGAIGLLVGNLTNVHCFGERTCGEQNPFPLLGAVLGVVAGQRRPRERWARMSADSTCAGERP